MEQAEQASLPARNPAHLRHVRLDPWRLVMNSGSRANEHPKTEDDIQREELGPQGVPGAQDERKMTPDQKKRIPRSIDPGNTA